MPVARVAHTGGRLDRKKPFALDRQIERTAGRFDRSGRDVEAAAAGGDVNRGLQRRVERRTLGLDVARALAFVAGGADVGDVRRQAIELIEPGAHATQRDVRGAGHYAASRSVS